MERGRRMGGSGREYQAWRIGKCPADDELSVHWRWYHQKIGQFLTTNSRSQCALWQSALRSRVHLLRTRFPTGRQRQPQRKPWFSLTNTVCGRRSRSRIRRTGSESVLPERNVWIQACWSRMRRPVVLNPHGDGQCQAQPPPIATPLTLDASMADSSLLEGGRLE